MSSSQYDLAESHTVPPMDRGTPPGSLNGSPATRPRSGDRASLPLDRPRGLARHVVDDAVDPLHGIDDARGGSGEDLVRKAGPVGRHEVVGLDGSEGHGVLIRA